MTQGLRLMPPQDLQIYLQPHVTFIFWPTRLTLSCHMWPLSSDPQGWPFHALALCSTCAHLHQNVFIFFLKYHVHKFDNRQTNKQTNSRTEDRLTTLCLRLPVWSGTGIMSVPACLVWHRHYVYACLSGLAQALKCMHCFNVKWNSVLPQ